MRDAKRGPGESRATLPEGANRQVPYVEKTFFDSFYAAGVKGDVEDYMTIGMITDVESRFHYNATENSIIRMLSRLFPPARGGMIDAARWLSRRQQLRLLDVGSGSGHWVDFFREVFHVSHVHAVEIAEQMAGHLTEKYAQDDDVVVSQHNVADTFGPDDIGGPVDWISAIGVMFHIVDDFRWERAVQNLSACLVDDGLLLVGGEFGARTENVQFHRIDEFKNWKESGTATGAPEGEVRVNKRVRSLADWQRATATAGLEIVDLVRTDRDAEIVTPENDILLLRRRPSP